MVNDNICALSTAAGVGGVAIIRISGPSPLFFAEKMFRPQGKTAVKDFVPYMLYTGEFDAGSFKDYGMCVYFKAPKSYTGEDMAEYHVHGGIAIVNGLIKRLTELGCRPAARGEFTRRAFLNGKLSLSSAEGLIDMINSESEGEVKAGYYLYRENLKRKVSAEQDKLKAALAEIGANIDYPDEVEEEGVSARVGETLAEVGAFIDGLAATYFAGRKLTSGVVVGLVGRPNTGKSSILNSLLSYDKAIVSDVAGTTRDVVEGTLVINGVKFECKDTAGIRDSSDAVENIGIALSRRVLDEADVLVVVLDGSEDLTKEDEEILALTAGKTRIVAANKSDKGGKISDAEIFVSAKKGENIDKLKEMLFNITVGKIDTNKDFLTEQRHYEALLRARAALKKAQAALESAPLDMVSVEVEECWQILGEITGQTASEAVVDEIFSRFCVGK